MLAAVLAFLLLPAAAAPAWGIDASGSWTRVIDGADLTGGAGSDLAGTYLSLPAALSITITGAADALDTWEVQAARSDVSWDSSLHLSLLRTSAGIGAGSISGGLSFLEISPIEQTLFSGSGDRSSVQVQLRLSGVSVLVAQGGYATTITFTLMDTP